MRKFKSIFEKYFAYHTLDWVKIEMSHLKKQTKGCLESSDLWKLRPLKLLNDQAIGEPGIDREEGCLVSIPMPMMKAGAALGTDGPFTIGVFGDWGTGKTSLMRLIQRKLDDYEEEEVITVWFEAWRYAREEHLIIPLVSTIIGEVEKRSNKSNEPSRYKKVLNALRSVVYGISFKAKFGLTDANSVEFNASIKDMVEREEQLTKEETEDILIEQSLYFDAYDALSKLSADENPAKIILLIDDLDRCLPNVAIRLLEGIKLVFAQQGFVFVLGISRRVFDGYLRKIYDDFGMSDFKAQEYLEKIIQLPFAIPPHSARMESFASSLLEQLEEDDAKNLEETLPMIGIACAYNPRVTIQFVNNLLIDTAISAGNIEIGYFAITRSLQQRWNRVLNLLTISNESNILADKTVEWLTIVDGTVPIPSNDDLDGSVLELANLLRHDGALQSLLQTHQGQHWLKNHDLRLNAVQFIHEQREEPIEKETINRLIFALKYGNVHDSNEAYKALVEGTHFHNGNLNRMDLTGVNLSYTYLNGADFDSANLQDSNLESAQLEYAKFRNTFLGNTLLVNANLKYASLQNARLLGADLTLANLEKANLVNADLSGAKLINTVLTNADMRYARLSQAEYDRYTVLPNGIFWRNDIDMDMFTDPSHRDFWQPDWVKKRSN